MAERQFINGSREKKRRLGILALSGSEAHKAGNCPEPEELAELLDGRCESSRRAQLFLHLDSCESCFQEWLELSRVLKVQKKWKPGVVSIFSRKRVLAAAGSALAMAVSIVVFMATPFYQDSRPLRYQEVKKQTEREHVPDSVFRETTDRKKEEVDAFISVDEEEETMEQIEMPTSLPPKSFKSEAAAPAEEKTGVYRQRKVVDKDDAVQEKWKPVLETAPQTPAPKRAIKQVQDDSTQVVGSVAGAGSNGLDEYLDFLAMAEEFCRDESIKGDPSVLLSKVKVLQEKGAVAERHRQAVIEKVIRLLEEDVSHPILCERLALILCFDGGRDCGKKSNNTQTKNSKRE